MDSRTWRETEGAKREWYWAKYVGIFEKICSKENEEYRQVYYWVNSDLNCSTAYIIFYYNVDNKYAETPVLVYTVFVLIKAPP